MLLRHTASALALAATIGLNATPTPSPFSTASRPSSTTSAGEIGGGSGLTCLGCVAAGVIVLASGSLGGVWATFMAGGAQAVGYGGAIATCTAACTAYLAG
jgi:hypothetical protein